jgi:hypothetical protein
MRIAPIASRRSLTEVDASRVAIVSRIRPDGTVLCGCQDRK